MSQISYSEQLEDLHRQAEGSYRSGDIAGARQIWEAILQLDDQDQRALEGLQMSSLVDDRWSQFDEHAAPATEFHQQTRLTRELIDSGALEPAQRAVQRLSQQYPDHPETAQLQAELQRALAKMPAIEAALARAQAAAAAKNFNQAIAACQELLALDPGHREAELILEQCERQTGATGRTSVALSEREPLLELDLSVACPPSSPNSSFSTGAVAQIPPSGPPPQPVVQKKIADDEPSMRDLLEAAQDMSSREQEGPSWVDETAVGGNVVEAAVGAPSSDAMLDADRLVRQAREALTRGKDQEASALASRAMALWDGVPGAAEILAEARALGEKRSAEADSLLQEAIEEFDRGRPEQAMPLLQRALQYAPGHPEAEEYLARCSKALDNDALNLMMKAASTSTAMFETDLLSLSSKAGRTPPSGAGQRDDVSAIPVPPKPKVAAAKPPVAPTTPAATNAPQPPPPPPIPTTATTTSTATATTASSAAATPPARDREPVAAKTVPSKAGEIAKSAAKAVGNEVVARVKRALIGAAALLVLGGIGWAVRTGIGMFSGGDEGSGVAVAKVRPKPKPSNTATTPAAGTTSGPTSSAAPAPVTATPTYTKDDIPSLRARAKQLKSTGDLAGAVATLDAARAADPLNFEVSDELEKLRRALREQQANEARLKEAKDAWQNGEFEEAMRMLYRLPKELQPAQFNRWLANGWYNLGVQAMQAGDVSEASQFFHDGLELNPDDADMKRHREVCKRYRGRSTDATFSTYVSGLQLRGMND